MCQINAHSGATVSHTIVCCLVMHWLSILYYFESPNWLLVTAFEQRAYQ